jgi:alkanesulfonate monooxygenase SsuD/methylene tetrahydromethanopterin reductase-like flavin-dependent oxidoreductase (luciferase family)
MEGVLEADWPSVSRLAQLADEMEFEAIVPVGRWRGFGGETDFNGAGFECYSFAAGIGAQSRYPAVLVTSHVPSIHPVMAAKQAATVDHISRGRFALNIIAGWPALSRAHTHARRSWANAEGADNGAAISRGHPCARAARSVR